MLAVARILTGPTIFSPCHRATLKRELLWFDVSLAVPEIETIGPEPGLYWCREDAFEHISRARYMAALLNDMGLDTAEFTANYFGRAYWSDAYQVVAAVDCGDAGDVLN